MARSVPWRRTNSDACSWHQDEAANTTIYILREIGPTGFLLKEEGEKKTFKVYLGDPHRCNCQAFLREKDLCKHICWVLLKKFRVPRLNPVTWQLGLVEREINEILQGILARQDPKPTANARRMARVAGVYGESTADDTTGMIEQRAISEDDVCPICQEELLAKHLPVTYCKYGCGNSVHIKCMKVWAEHQQKSSTDNMIKCPFCRENFGPLATLRQEFRNTSVKDARTDRQSEHLGVTCKGCSVCPIVGKCYKCSMCLAYYLCQICFNTPTHTEHSFHFRQQSNQRWRPAERGVGTVLPQAVVNNLLQRDISDNDYDLLLQLDSQASSEPSDLTEETVHSFPLERVRVNSTLLAPGQQCRICLRAYQNGQFVRRLPCRHKFHKDCVDNWLLHQHPTCPIDGTTYTNEGVRQAREVARIRTQHANNDQNPRHHSSHPGHDENFTLEIPGIGIARRASTNSVNIRILQSRNSANGTSQNTNPPFRGRRFGEDRSMSLVSQESLAENVLEGTELGLSEPRNTHDDGSLIDRLQQFNEPSQYTQVHNTDDSDGESLPQIAHRLQTIPRPQEVGHMAIDMQQEEDRGSHSTRNTAPVSRKPPSGLSSPLENEAEKRSSRPRWRPLYREVARNRSCSGSRERGGSAEMRGRQQTNDQSNRALYVGHNPASIAGLVDLSELTAAQARLPQKMVVRPTGGRRVKTGPPDDPRYRWGNTEAVDGNMVMSGNAINGLTIGDLISK